MNTEFIQKQAKWSAANWRIALWKGINGGLIVAIGSLVAALANENWSEMDDQSRFLMIAGITLSVLKSVDMLLDQTLSNLRNQPPDKPAQPINP